MQYDCIIVGAGAAGSTAAYFLAREGARVLLLERGHRPGAKNLSGLSVYAHMMEPLFPGFEREAPLEGPVTRQEFWFMTAESAVTLGIRNEALSGPPYNRFTAFSTPFVDWLAHKAVGAGAELLTNSKVHNLVVENGAVRGAVLARPGMAEFRAPVVIVAEGAAALVSTRAGLRKKPQPEEMSLYVKETIALDAERIQERLGLRPGTTAIIGMLGASTDYVPGTSSLYTYRSHLSINVGTTVKNIKSGSLNPAGMMARLKNHPYVKTLIAGGRTVEFSAHLIPDGGLKAIPELVHPGALLAGDAAGLVNGIQGLNLAMYSGKFAAQAVMEAHSRGDFSKKGLDRYRELLESSFVLKDMRKNAKAPGFFERHPDIFDTYPKLLNELAYQVSMVCPVPVRVKRWALFKETLGFQKPWKTIVDMMDTLGAMY
jgi:electron transfer flavoprotein-quinone oxidoreductase